MSYYEEDFDYNKPLSISIWKKMFPFLKPHRKKLAIIAGLMMINAAIDVFLPMLLGFAIDNFITPGTTEGLPVFAAVSGGVVVIQAFMVIVFIRRAISVETHIAKDLREAVFNHLQTLSFSYYNTTPVGFMLARTTSDTSRIGDMVAWGLVDMFWATSYTVGVFIAMFALNARLALIVAATVPPLAVLTWFFQVKILRLNRKSRRLNSQMTGAMNEGITGARTTKTLVIEDQNSRDFNVITGKLKGTNTRIAVLRGIFTPLVMFIGTLATAFVLSQGGHEVMVGGLLLGTLSVFLNYSIGIFDPIQQIANVLSEFVATQANIERVSGLLERTPDITDTPEVIEKYGDNFSPKPENWEPIQGHITFEDVTFMYPDGTENVLENFSLDVPAGRYIAIVGETGAGKSTLVNLVCRFFEPTEGRVLVDGRDARERSQLWLHSSIGYVLQNPHLFSGTVRENIRYGRLDATDAEVEEAARLVAADRVIAKLPEGMDAQVGEGGNRLSTGEKQLISFARAVLADPRIFVLDEATSSVDTETEILIQNAIAHLLRGRTSFVIAHRLSTIRTADVILVVRDGHIVEQGSHRELLRKRGYYHELYSRQFSEEIGQKVLA